MKPTDWHEHAQQVTAAPHADLDHDLDTDADHQSARPIVRLVEDPDRAESDQGSLALQLAALTRAMLSVDVETGPDPLLAPLPASPVEQEPAPRPVVAVPFPDWLEETNEMAGVPLAAAEPGAENAREPSLAVLREIAFLDD